MAQAFPRTKRLVLLCQLTKCESGGGVKCAFTRVSGGGKGKGDHPAASRGSLDPVILVSVVRFFCFTKSESKKKKKKTKNIYRYIFLPGAQIQRAAAELQDGAAAFQHYAPKKKCTFSFLSLTFQYALCVILGFKKRALMNFE